MAGLIFLLVHHDIAILTHTFASLEPKENENKLFSDFLSYNFYICFDST